MANQPETATFEAAIYQLETTDPVSGGPVTANTGKGGAGHGDGINNLPLLQLANRTKHLNENTVKSEPGVSSYTVGDLLYAVGEKILAKLGIGASGRVLTSSGSAPQWSDALALSGAIQSGEGLRGPATHGTDKFALSTAHNSSLSLLSGAGASLTATASIYSGLVVVNATDSDSGVGLFLVDTDANVCVLVSQTVAGKYTANAGNAGTVNVFVDTGILKINNSTAGGRNFRVMLLRA